MKNKFVLLFCTVIILLVLVCGYLFLKKDSNTQVYTIKKWNNLAQNVEISISDDTILKSIKTIESDSGEFGIETGGEYTVFTLTGLKKGKTKVIVTIYNHDYTIEDYTVYDIEVLEDLSVRNLAESPTAIVK